PGRAGSLADRRGGRGGGDGAAAGLRGAGAQAVRHPGPARAGPDQGLTGAPVDPLLPVPTVLPLLTAAVLAAIGPVLRSRRRVLDAAAIAVAATVTAVLVVIMV